MQEAQTCAITSLIDKTADHLEGVMVSTNKQKMQQMSLIPGGWNALSNEAKDKIIGGIEEITRSMIPLIPQDLVQMLYSEGDDHRPVDFSQHQIMALIYIKNVGIPEDFFLQHIHTDAGMQYAIFTEQEPHQPFSDRTFSRLRKRLKDVYESTGRDILQEVTDIINAAVELEIFSNMPYNDLYNKVYRMDSLNVGMHGAHMSRLQLIYVVNRMNIRNIEATHGKDAIPEALQHYLLEKDHNKVVYYKGTLAELEVEAAKKGISVKDAEGESKQQEPITEDEQNQQNNNQAEKNRDKRNKLIAMMRLQTIADESIAIKKLVESLDSSVNNREYNLLVRVIDDQTKVDDQGKVIPKDNTEIAGTSLQNPYDDGTCRTKDHKTEQGYSANIVQRCSPGNYAVIVDRDIQPNTYADQEYARSFYRKHGIEGFNPNNPSMKYNAVCVDGLYCNSYELQNLAAHNGIKVFCGTLTGKLPDPILSEFKVDREEKTVTVCPAGKDVKAAKAVKDSEDIRIRMPKGCCESCDNCKKCGVTVLKNGEGSILLKQHQYDQAQTIANLSDPEYRKMVNKRNAVEGVPSVLRRTYDIDNPVYFGIWYARYNLMLSTTAMNLRVLLRYRKEEGKSASEKKAAA